MKEKHAIFLKIKRCGGLHFSKYLKHVAFILFSGTNELICFLSAVFLNEVLREMASPKDSP